MAASWYPATRQDDVSLNPHRHRLSKYRQQILSGASIQVNEGEIIIGQRRIAVRWRDGASAAGTTRQAASVPREKARIEETTCNVLTGQQCA